MNDRERLREMGMLDLCLAICAKHHVALEHLTGAKRRNAWPALTRARVELVAYLRSIGYSWEAMTEIVNLERTTLYKMYATHGPRLAKVVPIKQGEQR